MPLAPEELARAQDPAAASALRERALAARLRPAGGAALPALVLLDNVEEGLPLAALIATLGALDVTVLVTARHRPSVPGLTLRPLDVLDPDAARTLFAERYTQAGGAWEAARDGDAAARIAALLGRLPLAIELAAADAALDGAGVAALADHLAARNRLDPLTDPTDPQRGVRFAFGQSYAKLTPPIQAAFAVLGLPAGYDWPRGLIESLLEVPLEGVEDAPAPDAALVALAARSLVTLAAEDGAEGATEPRVRLHPLLRDYAGERIAALAVRPPNGGAGRAAGGGRRVRRGAWRTHRRRLRHAGARGAAARCGAARRPARRASRPRR